MAGVTFTTDAIPKGADRATGHRKGKDGKVAVTPAVAITEPNPSGSVNATARDVAIWLKFHLAGGVSANGTREVSIKNLGETKTPHNVIRLEGIVRAINPDTVQLSYGLAWLVYDHRGKKVISHGGLIDGFRVQLTMLPDENLGIAVLANLHDTRMNAALVNSLIDLYCDLPARDWNKYFEKVVEDEAAARKAELAAREKARDPDLKPTLPPAAYAGEYVHPAYGTATVTATDGKLALAWSSFQCPLEHFEGDTFRVTAGHFEEELVRFTVKDSKVVGMRFTRQDFKRK
jgi:CubicO group peptidase (beta-lactamase class C family)